MASSVGGWPVASIAACRAPASSCATLATASGGRSGNPVAFRPHGRSSSWNRNLCYPVFCDFSSN